MNELKGVITITATELKRNTGIYLDIVAFKKQPIYVIRQSKVIALLSPVSEKILK